jgi:hypothetical protein
MNIKIKIFDIFHLAFGYSVFVGKFIGETPHRINGHIANLIVEGDVYLEDMPIGGIMMGGRHPDGHVGIAMMTTISVTSDFIRDRDCYLYLRKVEII